MSNYKIHDSTGHWIARIFSVMRREFDTILKKEGITNGEWAVLAAIHEDQGSTPSEISNFVEMDRAAVTRILDKLTDEKEITLRMVNDADRRSVTVKLTPAGEQLVKELLKENQHINDAFLAGIPKIEVFRINQLLKTMCKNRPSSGFGTVPRFLFKENASETSPSDMVWSIINAAPE